jgi:hypothetical protein
MAVMSEREREFAHKAKMYKIAELIVPAGPPPWLRNLLSDLSFNVWSNHSIETIQPTRAELWEHLLTVNQSAIGLSKALQAPFISAFLASHSDVAGRSARSCSCALVSAATLASASLSSSYLESSMQQSAKLLSNARCEKFLQ